jgi:hypothetical protein
MADMKMKCSLEGLIENSISLMPSKHRGYYEVALREVYQNLRLVAGNPEILPDFLEHYCVKPLQPGDEEEPK